MALNQTQKLVWVIETIRKANRISFEDLNRLWMDNVDLSSGEELLKRTFHKWKWSILETFGLIIECEKSAPYRYYIENVGELQRGSVENWLLNTISVSNSLIESKTIKDRIILEDIPSGTTYLSLILEAMQQNRCIHISYRTYWSEEDKKHYLMPLCVKLFRQRWYMVAQVWTSGERLTFCLDRIRDFRCSSHTFDYPKDFSPEEYFDGCIGVATEGVHAEDITLKVSSSQSNYLRDLPLHDSQQETEQYDSYSIFTLRARPTYDFKQELLWHGEEIEVLKPLWLRKEMAGIIKRMWNKYNKE